MMTVTFRKCLTNDPTKKRLNTIERMKQVQKFEVKNINLRKRTKKVPFLNQSKAHPLLFELMKKLTLPLLNITNLKNRGPHV
jgi:hypothetical protein